ncbi:hypothetical protein [Luteimonas suaedae]|uniref:hypothetical protein n=1 Tax=Luteimonas suaedae TaxID=2605430 RepID=UPI0011EE4D63|nr:hypothetical protein [Luteimonas suaedae]
MKKFVAAGAVAVCVLLSGCAATVKRPTAVAEQLSVPVSATSNIYLFVKSEQGHDRSEDWELFRAEWRTAMAATASGAGRRFIYLDAMPSTFDEQGTLAVVDINDYRYLSQGARYGFGVMTGNAYVDADVQFYVVPETRLVGTRNYATSSTAWQGVFSAMTSKQVAAITDKMLKAIDSR